MLTKRLVLAGAGAAALVLSAAGFAVTTTSTTNSRSTPTTAVAPTITNARLTATVAPSNPEKPPASPPVAWCETGFADPYATAPAGATIVPAGNNASFNFSTPDTTYWFAPGTHTLGTGEYDSITPADGDTYIGAPRAILSGQGHNNYAFEGNPTDIGDEKVTIEYLTIEKFDPSNGAAAVNSNGNNGWTEKYNLITLNTPGAGLILGGDNTVADNCMTENGEYGFQGYSWVDENYETTFTGGATNITFTGNEVSFNNTQHTSSGVEGGGKFWQNGNVVVTSNYVHGNYGAPGLWADTDNAGFLIQGNYISNNGGEGLMYEISYNALVQDNTFVDNGIVNGPSTGDFPTGAIYISESGGDNQVPSSYAGELMITDNTFSDNYGGVVVYQNANRYCGDGQDPCPLIPPPGESAYDWIKNGPNVCPGDLSETSPVDYKQLCQWRSQNVNVIDNTFSFNPGDSVFGGQCSVANDCGQSGIFSMYSSTPAYPAYSVCSNISNNQNNVFNDNAYIGPWDFVYFSQGDVEGPAAWQSGAGNVNGSGDNFPPQDQQSTFLAAAPTASPFALRPGSARQITFGNVRSLGNVFPWVVGTNPVPGGYGIYRWNGTGWIPESGGAVAVAVDPVGDPWVINSAHRIWHWDGAAWVPYPGSGLDISAGANGSVWVVGTNGVPGGYGIYRWNGTGWIPESGGAVAVAVDPVGDPWVINSAHQIWHWDGAAWVPYPGLATDISVGANGSVWVVGTNPVPGGYGIYRWNGTGWDRVLGGAVSIAVDPSGNHPWVTNSLFQIFSS